MDDIALIGLIRVKIYLLISGISIMRLARDVHVKIIRNDSIRFRILLDFFSMITSHLSLFTGAEAPMTRSPFEFI